MPDNATGFGATNLRRLLRDAIEVGNFPVQRADPSIVIHNPSQFLKLERRLSRLGEGYILLQNAGIFFLLWSKRVFVFESRQGHG